jgi:hypothetical protein
VNYIKAHWRGAHSLKRAVLVNFLPLFALLWWMPTPLAVVFQDDAMVGYAVVSAYCVIAFLLILPWQVVGVMRSCERYLVDYGNPVLGRVVQAAVIGAVLAAGIAALNAVQQIGARQNDLDFGRLWEERTTRVYDLKRIDGTRLAHLRGDMQNGTTRVLEQWLEDNEDIEGIVLDSSGGRVYEGRGVARVVSEHGLDTYTLTGCYSACTTAFIAGRRRYLAQGARLGFHQYRYDSVKSLGYLDSSQEQEKDRAWFRGRRIDERFLERVFDKPGDEMWFPDVDMLLEYRVIHGVVDRSRIIPARGDD